MTDVETLAERVRTVERAVTDGDHDFPTATDLGELSERVRALEQQLETVEDRTEELEAATQALRGYVGNVRSVNEQVENRADTALAATERLERRLDAMESERSKNYAEAPKQGPVEKTPGGGSIGAAPRGVTSAERRDGEVDASGESEDHETGTRDGGVIEQIRSLL
jgi:chromosome segregation ATPase